MAPFGPPPDPGIQTTRWCGLGGGVVPYPHRWYCTTTRRWWYYYYMLVAIMVYIMMNTMNPMVSGSEHHESDGVRI